MLDEDGYGGVDAFNKAHKADKATVLAVYGEPKGDNAGAFVIECSSEGRDGEIVLLVAFKSGKGCGAAVKKQNESYFNKLPADILDNAIGTDGKVNADDLAGKTGATLTRNAMARALGISGAFAAEKGEALGGIISELAKGGTEANA